MTAKRAVLVILFNANVSTWTEMDKVLGMNIAAKSLWLPSYLGWWPKRMSTAHFPRELGCPMQAIFYTFSKNHFKCCVSQAVESDFPFISSILTVLWTSVPLKRGLNKVLQVNSTYGTYIFLLSMYILETRPCYNNVFMAGGKCRKRRFFFFFIIVKKKCFVQRLSIKSNLEYLNFCSMCNY